MSVLLARYHHALQPVLDTHWEPSACALLSAVLGPLVLNITSNLHSASVYDIAWITPGFPGAQLGSHSQLPFTTTPYHHCHYQHSSSSSIIPHVELHDSLWLQDWDQISEELEAWEGRRGDAVGEERDRLHRMVERGEGCWMVEEGQILRCVWRILGFQAGCSTCWLFPCPL